MKEKGKRKRNFSRENNIEEKWEEMGRKKIR